MEGKNRLIFVTAQLVDPAGVPINSRTAAAPPEAAVEPDEKAVPKAE